jgi:glyoxylase-like metal-dependent hydrolase (beta-lactamase superfamily II)
VRQRHQCQPTRRARPGWVWHNGEPFFPNAIVKFGRGDWETYVENGTVGADDPGLRALAGLGKVELSDGDGDQVAPGVTARHTPGHTPGHQIYVVSSQGARALFLGDAVPCPIQLDNPSLATVTDMDASLTTATRELILRELDDDDLVGGPHFPGLRFSRMLVGSGRRYWS